MRKITIVFFSVLIAFSCSSDDDNNPENNNLNNAFTISGTSYSLTNVYLNDENIVDNNPSDIALIMSNVDLLTANQPSGINYVYFDFQGVELQTGTITNISDYTILENASFINSEIDNGNTILDDSESGFMATNTSVTINSFSSSQIDFNFSFTREDGQIITGNYSGSFIDLNE